MVTTSLITTGFNAFVLALTPIERWNAARRIDSASSGQYWFILLCVIAIIVLTAMFIASSYSHKIKERKAASRIFDNYAQRRGLSRSERQILLDITNMTGLKRIESIFTTIGAFDRGAAELTKDILERRGAKAGRNLSAQLSVLREKLGFEKKSPAPAGSAVSSNKPSTKQIPAGKKLHMTRRKVSGQADIESTVIENNDVELTVKLEASLESKPGELWSVRYYYGASVWEFETSSISCYGNILILNHSDNIRFINRRRFLRVPVNKPTFIARFPFTKMFLPKSQTDSDALQDSADISGDNWGPPEFVQASVTELAGPGLRIEAPLEVKVGDRVLVILKLSEENQKPGLAKADKATPEKIIEDIGQVRHTKSIKNGFSIAVELTGLSDPNISELIRATNAASLKTRDKTKAAEAFGSSNNKHSEESEPAVTQGV
jgi:hypothetical protein